MYQNRLAEALADGHRALELARQASNLRHELLAHNVLTSIACFSGDFAGGLEHARRTLELGRAMGSRRFLVDGHTQLAHLLWGLGRVDEAGAALRAAVAALEPDLLAFGGAYVYGMQALCASSAAERHRHLEAGERLLAASAVSHCHLYFYCAAMEACLEHGEHDAALHYASGLEAYTAGEPLPFAEFFVRRARALADDGPMAGSERAALVDLADRAGLGVGRRLLAPA
jgi:tetratricopeptide (TPR) repeat protein